MTPLSLSSRSALMRPSLLMVSHCVPTWRPSTGNAEGRRRAWQLLAGVSSTHEVYLACLSDGPVSLQQWRELSKRVKQVVIAPLSFWRRSVAGLISAVAASSAERFRIGGAFAQPVNEWSSRIEMSTVLHTRPSLLNETQQVNGAKRVVDVASLAAVERGALAGCDRLIVRSDADARAAATIGLRAMVLPSMGAGLTLTGAEEYAALALPATLKKAA